MSNRIMNILIALIMVFIGMVLLTPNTTQAVDYTKTQTKYGRRLSTMGVKTVALFNSDTGEFSSHGKETKYGESHSLAMVQKIRNLSKTSTTYLAKSSFELYEYHVFIQTHYYDYLDFVIETDGSW